jgi:hypothetical protein
MWKNLLNLAVTGISSIYIYLIVGGASAAIAGYGVYSWTSDYYQVKIEHANIESLKEKDELQRKGDLLVADYIKQVEQLTNNNANLQRQISLAVKHNDGSSCVVSDGFVRLFNASAAGQSSTPSNTDGASSAVDEATLLAVITENNEKYNKLAEKLTKLQEFERSHP